MTMTATPSIEVELIFLPDKTVSLSIARGQTISYEQARAVIEQVQTVIGSGDNAPLIRWGEIERHLHPGELGYDPARDGNHTHRAYTHHEKSLTYQFARAVTRLTNWR